MTHRVRTAFVLLVLAAMVLAACGQKHGVHLSANGGSRGGSAADNGSGSGNDLGAGDQSGAGDTGTGSTGAGGTSAASGVGGTGGAGSVGGSGVGQPGSLASGAGGGPSAAGPGGPGDTTGVTNTEIRVGIHAPVTGAAPFPNTSFTKGKELYFDFLNDTKGGVNGRKVKVFFEDDGYNPSQAVSVCKKMVQEDHVFMLIGGGGTDQIVACAQYAASAGVPYVAEGVTEQGLSQLSSYFALSKSYKQQGALLGQYMKNVLHVTKVGMVRANTANFEDAHQGFLASAQQNGLQVVLDDTIPKNASQSDAQTEGGKIARSGAQAVYPLMAPSIWINLAVAAKSQAYVGKWAGVGITMGLNIVATAVCGAAAVQTGQATFFSPFPGIDKINSMDPDYNKAYNKYNGGNGDDIGVALWGAEKLVAAQLAVAGHNLTRQSYVASVSGKAFDTGVYPAVNYAGTRFGGTAVHVLSINCAKQAYDTQFVNKNGF